VEFPYPTLQICIALDQPILPITTMKTATLAVVALLVATLPAMGLDFTWPSSTSACRVSAMPVEYRLILERIVVDQKEDLQYDTYWRNTTFQIHVDVSGVPAWLNCGRRLIRPARSIRNPCITI
jgi:hypothetical protein